MVEKPNAENITYKNLYTFSSILFQKEGKKFDEKSFVFQEKRLNR